MSKAAEQDVRRKLRRPTYIFFAAFCVGSLGVVFGDELAAGTALDYVIRGSLLITVISGFYIAIVAFWNYTLTSDD
jgi:hypothetical protein